MARKTMKPNCDCNGASGMEICSDLNFKRPRFFAGQLLTEDDLQALTEYVVGKNRLHNRFLFGDGVVCGLSVTCHPCGKGQVSVAPGFALDCCGNDILVPCKEDLDIKGLLRDLHKRRLAGYDCGDPCSEKNGDDRSYGLYLTYTESMEDPVVPYTNGDPCGQQACEPTRVCEGYKFELRCDCDLPMRTDFFKRVCACIGDMRQAAAAISRAQTSYVQAVQLQGAAQVIKAETEIPFGEDSAQALKQYISELEPLQKVLDESIFDDNDVTPYRPDEGNLRLDVARLQLLTGAFLRFQALSTKERKEAVKSNEGLDNLLSEAKATIAAVGPVIEVLAPKVMKSPFARVQAEETVALSREFVVNKVSVENQDDDGGSTPSYEAQLLRLNTVGSSRQINQMKSEAELLKGWLLEKLAESASLTRCDLYDRVRRIQIEEVSGQSVNAALATISNSSQGVKDLVQILVEYLIDCICLALNPPCQACEDRSVLLACVKVRDCEVIEICNLSRRFVLTPVAMRYWLPPIGFVEDLLKKLCCECDVSKLLERGYSSREIPPSQIARRLGQATPTEMPIAQTYASVMSEPALDNNTALVLQQLRIEPGELETVKAFTTNLALLAARVSPIEPVAIANRGVAIAEAIGGLVGRNTPAEAMSDATFRASMADMVTDEVQKSLPDFRASVAAELTKNKLRTALQETDVIKNLQAQNFKLTNELKTLSAAVAALNKGGNA